MNLDRTQFPLMVSLPFGFCVLDSENINLSLVACQSRMIVIVSAITSVIAQPYKLHPQADRTMFPLHPHLPPIGFLFWWLFNSTPSVTTDTIPLSVYVGRTNVERVKTKSRTIVKQKIQPMKPHLLEILLI